MSNINLNTRKSIFDNCEEKTGERTVCLLLIKVRSNNWLLSSSKAQLPFPWKDWIRKNASLFNLTEHKRVACVCVCVSFFLVRCSSGRVHTMNKIDLSLSSPFDDQQHFHSSQFKLLSGVSPSHTQTKSFQQNKFHKQWNRIDHWKWKFQSSLRFVKMETRCSRWRDQLSIKWKFSSSSHNQRKIDKGLNELSGWWSVRSKGKDICFDVSDDLPLWSVSLFLWVELIWKRIEEKICLIKLKRGEQNVESKMKTICVYFSIGEKFEIFSLFLFSSEKFDERIISVNTERNASMIFHLTRKICCCAATKISKERWTLFEFLVELVR